MKRTNVHVSNKEMVTSFMPTLHFNPSYVNQLLFDPSIVHGHVVKRNILTLLIILNNGVHDHKLFYNFVILKDYCNY